MPTGAPEITFVTDIPDRPALEAHMTDYYAVMIPKLVALGGPEFPVDVPIADMWENLDEFLPPNGRIAMAHDADGHLVGTGFMRICAPGAAEMKRLFVTQAHQGTGLGRRLVEARIEEARAMGLKAVYADALKGNLPMLRLYEKLGFVACERYPGNGNLEAVLRHSVFRRLDL